MAPAMAPPVLHDARVLVAFADALLARAGLDAGKARDVADVLVEGDLLGHTTHGLQLLPAYLDEIEGGRMERTGEPVVVSDRTAAVTWDGRRLPGPFLVRRALDLACARASLHGTCSVAIRRSHHAAALAAYLRPVAERGLLALVTCSDPGIRGVVPHGGRRDVMTPNPIAAAWPTDGAPVVLDVSTSITTHGLTRRLAREGGRFPGTWAIDADGRPTDDPAAVLADPPGALLPAGGLDHGHKGYALGLLVEALTGGLAGHGRADPHEGWAANVLVQVLDPAAFGGTDAFIRQASFLADACRASTPRDPDAPVRLPGEAALARRARQLADGVALYPGVLEALAPWSERLAVPLPGRARQ
jgi:LDH2 family malate/lactate/ureidoglycolate dehydrogenase